MRVVTVSAEKVPNPEYLKAELAKVIAQRDDLAGQVRDLSKDGGAAYWRKVAQDTKAQLVQTQDRLTSATSHANDLRHRADSAKAAHQSALDRVNDVQAQIVTLSADLDEARQRLVKQDQIKQRLWELFVDL